LAGSLLASKLWYTSYIFPPLIKHIDAAQKLLNNWVRGDSKSLPAASIIQLPKSSGGWNLTNVKSAIKARSTMTTKKMFTSRERWASNRLASVYAYQIPRNKTQKLYKKRDWPPRLRPAIKTWFEANRPLVPDQTTATVTTFFKKNLYLKRYWPTSDRKIWKNLGQLNLPPQAHVNAWRWHRGALPLKDRVWWSSSLDSTSCRWCPSSPQTHHHFLYDCKLTKKILKKLNNLLGRHLTLDPLISSEISDADLPYLWLSAWLIDYVWRATARANFDDSITEESIIETSPHTLRMDAKIFLATLTSKDKKLITVKNVIESIV
jgi:hypothetical protein